MKKCEGPTGEEGTRWPMYLGTRSNRGCKPCSGASRAEVLPVSVVDFRQQHRNSRAGACRPDVVGEIAKHAILRVAADASHALPLPTRWCCASCVFARHVTRRCVDAGDGGIGGATGGFDDSSREADASLPGKRDSRRHRQAEKHEENHVTQFDIHLEATSNGHSRSDASNFCASVCPACQSLVICNELAVA